ncbi:phosphatase domain-containing protein [Novosphingobium sp. RD2P27]|uniref:Phosphatase domain-containing protein n=1 Tax=Novosphingobium kalidii TaxID=3230299 RepID=A0ABV2D3A0_9SPHN
MTSSSHPLRQFLHRVAHELEGDLEGLQNLLSGDRRDDQLRMLAFAGYRNDAELRVRGRMVRSRNLPTPNDTTWSKFRAMLAIYNSHEVSGVRVRCEAEGQIAETMSDEEGYFSFAVPLDKPLPQSTTWEAVRLATPGHVMQAPSIVVPVLAPGRDNHWGIISDIDDTVIETGTVDFLKNWRRILAERPEDRIAVPGASDLYRVIARDHVAPTRPFFYVSSSPWSLYEFLTEFMELNRIPHGPMFLKDLGIDATKLIDSGHEKHKIQAIRTILEFYPGHKFLLMGDNGQKDVEIYSEAVRAFPDRVGAVFIRDVTQFCASGAKAELLAQISAAGVQTYCAPDFAGAVSVLETLGVERPVEATKAAGQDADSGGSIVKLAPSL